MFLPQLPTRLALVLVSITACDHAPPPIAPDLASSSDRVAAASSLQPVAFFADGRPPTLDEVFADIATRVPGFAGAYYDRDGTLMVNVVDARDTARAGDEVLRVLQRSQSGQSRRLRFRRAAFDYSQLMRWSEQAHRSILMLPGVVSTDIDEVNNRIAIEVMTASAHGEVRRLTGLMGIPASVTMAGPVPVEPDSADPPDATDTASVAPGTPDGSTAEQASGTTLNSAFSSLPGGVQIGTARQLCTLGFNAYLSSTIRGIYSFERRFVTAAHCTDALGGVEGTAFYQPLRSSGSWVGNEVREPLWNASSNCPAGARCAYADVALFTYTGHNWELGRIAKTTSVGVGTQPGSLTIDASSPRFHIRDSVENHTVFSGSYAHKVGAFSGWTTGPVVETCGSRRLIIDGILSNFVLLCQWAFSGGIRVGDSGAPVFVVKGFGVDVSLAGIVWGGDANRTRFSFYSYIAFELTDRDRAFACAGAFPCWPRLTVSSP